MSPAFKIGRDDRIYLTDKYLCNGHWLVKRVVVAHRGPKPLKKLRRTRN